MPSEKGPKRCSFCGRPETAAQNIFSAGGANICDSCVVYCYEMLMNNEQLGYIPDPEHFDRLEKNSPPKELKIKKPSEIKAVLDEYIIGQDMAKIALSVAVYNHYKRIAAGSKEEKMTLSFRSQTLSSWVPQVLERHLSLQPSQKHLTFPLRSPMPPLSPRQAMWEMTLRMFS